MEKQVFIFSNCRQDYTSCPFQFLAPIKLTTQAPGPVSCNVVPTKCPHTPYRSFDGSCNNLHNPGYGLTNSRYIDYCNNMA